MKEKLHEAGDYIHEKVRASLTEEQKRRGFSHQQPWLLIRRPRRERRRRRSSLTHPQMAGTHEKAAEMKDTAAEKATAAKAR